MIRLHALSASNCMLTYHKRRSSNRGPPPAEVIGEHRGRIRPGGPLGISGLRQDRSVQPGYDEKYLIVEQRLPSVNNRPRKEFECEHATGEPPLIAESATFSCT